MTNGREERRHTKVSGITTSLRCFAYVKPYAVYVVTAGILMLARRQFTEEGK